MLPQFSEHQFLLSDIIFAILGMVLGWGSLLSIGVYVYNELSYNRFHEKGERILKSYPQ